jgi:predicted phage gp36 major capsid-like protein
MTQQIMNTACTAERRIRTVRQYSEDEVKKPLDSCKAQLPKGYRQLCRRRPLTTQNQWPEVEADAGAAAVLPDDGMAAV